MLACLTIYFVNVSPLNVKLTSLSYVHQYIFLSSTTYTVAIVFKFREMLLTGNRRNRALFTRKKIQNFGCLSNCRYCADRAQNLPGPAPNDVLRVLQISSKSLHFRRSYSRTREHRQIALWSKSDTRPKQTACAQIYCVQLPASWVNILIHVILFAECLSLRPQRSLAASCNIALCM